MDKNAIKKYAVWARRELIERVSQRALRFGITADGNADPKADSVDGYLLSAVEKKQRAALIKKVEEHGYEQVLEEAAYTWFNRFAALRFMEVNGYLPSHVRVFTNDAGEFKPQILAEAIHLELDGLNMDKVYELKDANNTEELYRYLLIVQCNALSSILPGMFQRIEDYTELLLPENLLREGSVLQQMIELIPEEDWQEQVQIIGWLYQYYNSEPKTLVDANVKKGIKVSKEELPAKTQLFTNDWIVHYMVENSLGRLWIERKLASGENASTACGGGGPSKTVEGGIAEAFQWKYYLPEAEQEPEVAEKLAEIRKTYADMKPEEIKVIDPCMGSGHILCYLFDVLVQIYEDYGHTAREAVESILTNNLYGLDIDDRAAQLAYFAVMMKGRQYDRRFFSRGIQPHVMAIQETNDLERFEDVTGYPSTTDARKPLGMLERLMDIFEDARDYGSLLKIPQGNYQKAVEFIEEGLHSDLADDLFNLAWLQEMAEIVPKLVEQANIMSQKYDVVVSNPPYLGSKYMSEKLGGFIKKTYPESKSDLFSVFMEKTYDMTNSHGFTSLITMESWMFLSSFEKFRKKILSSKTIINMVHMPYLGKGNTSLGINFGTAAVVIYNGRIKNYNAQYEYTVYYETDENGVPFIFPTLNERWKTARQERFSKIPGSPLAYWVSDIILEAFSNNTVYQLSHSPSQNVTGNNNRYVRFHWELDKHIIGFEDKWIFYAKGGDYRRWWGNLYDVINWTPEARYIYQHGDGNHASQIINKEYWYKKGITWGLITSAIPSFRIMPEGATFDKGGSTIIINDEYYYYLLGILNSKVYISIISILNPTLNAQVRDIRNMPLIDNKRDDVNTLVEINVKESKEDWDSFETSWDFKVHHLINRDYYKISEAFCFWSKKCNARFDRLKANEEELNRIFIGTYGLGEELTPEVADKDVTVARIYDTKEEIPDSMKGNNYVLTKEDVIKSFISYAVGCMFGRYSLDVEGLAYAGGDWDASKYKTFLPDRDAIIPICDDEYFEDDIVGRFVQFVEVVYGRDTLEENLQFIADALGGKGTSREVIRNYFVSSFYADHVKTYKKRPIYWLFDSGKKNGFKCLIYMHRYQPDTLARIRTDYIHEQQSRYRTVIESLEQRIAAAGSSSEKVKLTKLLNTRQAQAKEIREYEEKVHHLADQMIKIDLDDGVKHNYAIFKDVLAKIK